MHLEYKEFHLSCTDLYIDLLSKAVVNAFCGQFRRLAAVLLD